MKKQNITITGIQENNLTDAHIEFPLNKITLLKGKSGSGKSTVAFNVLAAEAKRQKKIFEKSDQLYFYSLRPDFKEASRLPDSEVISQKILSFNHLSTFGITSGINQLLKKAFIAFGKIKHGDEIVIKRNLSEITIFQGKYYPHSKLYYLISEYESISVHAKKFISKYSKNIFIRNKTQHSLNKVSEAKIQNINENKYEIFIKCEDEDLSHVFDVFLIDDYNEINFSIYSFPTYENILYRLPSNYLFSTSTQSSLSGCCFHCQAKGFIENIQINKIIEPYTSLDENFILLPLQPSGRYKGLKYLPKNLLKKLEALGANLVLSFSQQLLSVQKAIVNVIEDKLKANSNDVFVQSLIQKNTCPSCDGTKLSYYARKVTINDHSIDYYWHLNGRELLNAISNDLVFKNKFFTTIICYLHYLQELSLDHIELDRKTDTLSSGEKQRCKIIPLLLHHANNQLIIIDEPSSNLHYADNLKLIKIIHRLKSNCNTIVIVEHNPLYEIIADKIYLAENNSLTPVKRIPIDIILSDFSSPDKCDTQRVSELTFSLNPLRNIQLDKITFPLNKITAIVGSSGTGKSTLSKELIYPKLLELDHNVQYIGADLPKGNSTSVVATYINIFDHIRDVFSKSTKGEILSSDFSFNSSGACQKCTGQGEIDGSICNQCFGTRYKTAINLYKYDQLSLPELMELPLKSLLKHDGFKFLKPVIDILEQLSLAHISLGRQTSTLSGGELQRIKLAKFLVSNVNKKYNTQQIIILDEPCKGLDLNSIKKLFKLLHSMLNSSTLIIIEHNPYLIYKADYIIDLGLTQGVKNSETITIGYINKKIFPSLNHRDLFLKINSENIYNSNLDHAYIENINGKIKRPEIKKTLERYNFIPDIYKEQNNFYLEKHFSENFSIKVPDDNIFFYRSIQELKIALSENDEFYFNPFLSYLDKYPILPVSIKNQVLKQYNIKNMNKDLWSFVLLSESLDHAIYNGSGVVIVKKEKKYYYHGIRLLSLIDKVFDKIYPQKSIFNLYKNACDHCHGYGKLKSYSFEQFINDEFEIMHKNACTLPIYKVLPKMTMKYFEKEKLFDFSKKIKEMTENERNVLFYGFKSMKFLKEKGNKNIDSDYYEWRGLNSYIYKNVENLTKIKNFNDQLTWITCPFCIQGFRKSILYYQVNQQSFINKLRTYE